MSIKNKVNRLKKMPLVKIAKWGIALAIAVFGGEELYKHGKYVPDNAYEEILEEMIEDGMEETFNMSGDMLNDTVDLSKGEKDVKPSRVDRLHRQ